MAQKRNTTQLKKTKTTNQKVTARPNQPDKTQRATKTNRPTKINKNLAKRPVRSFKVKKPAKKVKSKYALKNRIFTQAIRNRQMFTHDYKELTGKSMLYKKSGRLLQKRQKPLLKKNSLSQKSSEKLSAEPMCVNTNVSELINHTIPGYTGATSTSWLNLLHEARQSTPGYSRTELKPWHRTKTQRRSLQITRQSERARIKARRLRLLKHIRQGARNRNRKQALAVLSKWVNLKACLYAQQLIKKVQKGQKAALKKLIKSKFGRKFIKKVQKGQKAALKKRKLRKSKFEHELIKITDNKKSETALPTRDLLQRSSSRAGKLSSLQAEYTFSKTQNVEKALLLYKNLSSPSANRVKHFVDENKLPVAKRYTNNSYPNTNTATYFKATKKRTVATIQRSLRWYNPAKKHSLKYGKWLKPIVGCWYKNWVRRNPAIKAAERKQDNWKQKREEALKKEKRRALDEWDENRKRGIYAPKPVIITKVKRKWYVRWKQRRKVRKSKQIRLVRRFRKVAKMSWPRERTKPSERRIQKRRLSWKKRKTNNRTISKAIYRDHAASLPTKGRLQYNLRKFRLQERKVQINRLPAYSLTYKLRYRRWHSYRKETGAPVSRAWKTARQQRQRDALNLRLWRSGRKTKRYPDKTYRELEVLTGTPSSLGYRRVRRAHKVKFSTNRWWQLRAVPTPQLHPLALARAHPSSFINQRQYKKFISQQPKLSNNCWRRIDSAFNTVGSHEIKSEGWNYKNVATAVTNITSQAPNLWRNAKKVISDNGKSASCIKQLFIQGSQTWLKERYIEQLARSWSKAQLASFSVALQQRVQPDAIKLRRLLISRLRKALFQMEPNWWDKETKRRVAIFSSTVSSVTKRGLAKRNRGHLLKKKHVSLISLLRLYRSNVRQEETARAISNGSNESNLLRFVVSQLLTKEKNSIIGSIKTGVVSQKAIQDKAVTPAFQLWLSSATRHFKLPNEALSSQQHDLTKKNVVTNLELARARFPGVARSKATFDAALRAFYRRTIPARFRRNTKFRFKEARPTSYLPRMQASAKYELTANAKLRRAYRKTLAKVPFVTARWRRLLAARNHRDLKAKTSTPKQTEYGVTKRRFVSNPNAAVAKLSNAKFCEKRTANANFANEILLNHAMGTRINEIAITKVLKQLEKRKLPAEQILPPWKRRGNKRCVLSQKNLLPHPNERRIATQWALKRLSLRVSSFRQLAPRYSSISGTGEVLTKPLWVRRSQWAKTTGSLLRRSRNLIKLGAFRRAAKQTSGWKKQRLVEKAWHIKNALQAIDKAKSCVSHQLVQTAANKWKPAALLFRRTASDQSKKTANLLTPKQLAAFRTERFRVTKEYVNATTKILHRLVEWLVRKQIKNRAVSKKELSGLVHATYWSVRIYLAQDPFKKKLATRDMAGKLVTELKDEMLQEAAARAFSARDMRSTRYQLQPLRINKGRSLLRGARDWLRAYFPRKYSLYLEDPEEYRKLALNPMQIFRSHPNRGNPGTWKTDKVEGTLEKRRRRLSKLASISSTSNRFENMLITTKTTAPVATSWNTKPTIIGATAAPRTHFFKRSFSTYRPNAAAVNALKIITNRLGQQNRLGVSNNDMLSVFTSATQQHQLKETGSNREQNGGTFKQKELGLSRLNLSLTRLKSPRNQEYLDRKKDATVQEKILAWKEQYEALKSTTLRMDKEAEEKNLWRTSRRYTAGHKAKISVTIVRANHCRSTITKKTARLTKNKHSRKARAVKAVKLITLRLRKASDRLKELRFKKALTLTRGAAKLHPKFGKKLKAEFKPRFLFRNLKWSLRHGKLSPLTKELFVVKAARVQKELWKKRTTFRIRRKAIAANSGRQLRRLAKTYDFERRSQFVNQLNRTKAISIANRPSQINYLLTAAKRRAQFKQKSARITTLEKRATTNIHFDGRLEVWDKITKFRNKRFRIVKTWVENIKYKMNQKKWKRFTYAAFKQTRSRIRAIEWKEPDRHFFRSGWRKAFRFGPSGARWMEALMYRRALYSTRRGAYRRYQYPREQKRLKWLQFFRRAVLNPNVETTYIKRRRWVRVRTANQRLQRSLFALRNTSSARRFVSNKSKKTPHNQSGFEHFLTGLGNRLDVTLLLLNIAPSPFWARELAPMGLLRVNGKVIRKADHRLNPGDVIQWEWARIARFKRFFQPASTERRQKIKMHRGQPRERRRGLAASALIPLNFRYQYALRTAVYERLPRPEDLPPGNRLAPILLKWFWADSGRGK